MLGLRRLNFLSESKRCSGVGPALHRRGLKGNNKGQWNIRNRELPVPLNGSKWSFGHAGLPAGTRRSPLLTQRLSCFSTATRDMLRKEKTFEEEKEEMETPANNAWLKNSQKNNSYITLKIQPLSKKKANTNSEPRRTSRSLYQQIKDVPSSFQRLFSDMFTNRYINDVMSSKAPNAWSHRTYPPRRQLEHQRRLRWDLRTVLPIAVLYVAIPIAGNILPVLAVVCMPRWMLSRQFHDDAQKWDFAALECEYRKVFFKDLAALICTEYNNNNNNDDEDMLLQQRMRTLLQSSNRSHGKKVPPHEDEEAENEEEEVNRHDDDDFLCYNEDAAGPVILNMNALFSLVFFSQTWRTPIEKHHARIPFSSLGINTLSRHHLKTLFLASGMFKLPPTLSSVVSTCLPSFVMRYFLHSMSRDIVQDDQALLAEGQAELGCTALTQEEILAACALRGLPIMTTHVEMMRVCLTHHLIMMRHALEEIKSYSGQGGGEENGKDRENEEEALKLLVLHLPALRYGLKQ